MTPSEMNSYFEERKKIAIHAGQALMVMGAAFVLSYFVKIGFCPQEVTLGDGVFFVLFAICFSIVYTVLMASIYFSARFLIRIFWHDKLDHDRHLSVAIVNAALDLICLIPAAFLGYGFYRHRSLTEFIILCVFTLVAAGIERYYEVKIIAPLPDHYDDDQKRVDILVSARMARTRLTLFAFIVAFPLLLGGVFSGLLDATARLAGVRMEHATIYVKAPYSSVVTKKADSTQTYVPDGYAVIQNATVLFRGYGKNALIEIPGSEFMWRIEIPNDHMIITTKARKPETASMHRPRSATR